MIKLKDFEEKKRYQVHLSEGLKIPLIKGNRDSFKWVSHWLPILEEKDMAIPATFVHASTVKAIGLSPVIIDAKTTITVNKLVNNLKKLKR